MRMLGPLVPYQNRIYDGLPLRYRYQGADEGYVERVILILDRLGPGIYADF